MKTIKHISIDSVEIKLHNGKWVKFVPDFIKNIDTIRKNNGSIFYIIDDERDKVRSLRGMRINYFLNFFRLSLANGIELNNSRFDFQDPGHWWDRVMYIMVDTESYRYNKLIELEKVKNPLYN